MSFNTPIFTSSNQKQKSKSKLSKVCIFCNKKIKDGYLVGTKFNGNICDYDPIKIDSFEDKLIFCDLICARLYDVNIHKISIDFKSYKDFYNNGKLSSKAVKVYNRCKGKLFSEMLIMKVCDNFNLLEPPDKKEYISKIKLDYYTCI